jgi:hypothetical protein
MHTEWIEGINKGVPEEPAYASVDEFMQNWHRFRGLEGAGIANLEIFH